MTPSTIVSPPRLLLRLRLLSLWSRQNCLSRAKLLQVNLEHISISSRPGAFVLTSFLHSNGWKPGDWPGYCRVLFGQWRGKGLLHRLGEAGEDFAATSKRYPGHLFALTANVTLEESITAAVDKIVEEAGAIHGMVVKAGRTNHKAALDFTQENTEALFSVNVSSHMMGAPLSCRFYCKLTLQSQLFGAFYTARAAARAFIKLNIKGSVVFTAFMASYRPNKVCGIRKGFNPLIPGIC
jgi:hypothetical protein